VFSNRPLFATRADARFYWRTPESVRFEEALRREQHALLIGERGMGKTTTLHMVELDSRDAGRPVCFVSLAQAERVDQAMLLIDRAVREAGWLQGPPPDAPPGTPAPFVANEIVRRLHDAPPRGLLLVDDVTAEIGHALFGRMRDELWQLPLIWGVATAADEAFALLSPPADAFFEERVRLVALDPEARRDLLATRSTHGADRLAAVQIDQLAASGPGNIRRLIGRARDVAEGRGRPKDLFAAGERRRAEAERVGGRPAVMLVGEMEDLGPVSAGDDVLLDRLGWTRPRAAELLLKLEQAGVVSSDLERRRGPGRPRKLFELRPISDFLEAR
jgi:hypothetical protein